MLVVTAPFTPVLMSTTTQQSFVPGAKAARIAQPPELPVRTEIVFALVVVPPVV
jgi:hypothetical protein